MANTADRVMDDYSSLDEEEQAKFDRRYKELMAFRRNCARIFKEVVGRRKSEANDEQR